MYDWQSIYSWRPCWTEGTEMYLIAKQTGGYQAIPIKARDKWDFHKLTIGMQEIRIIFRLHGRRYLLYHTREITKKYPGLRREHLVPYATRSSPPHRSASQVDRSTSSLIRLQEPPNADTSGDGATRD